MNQTGSITQAIFRAIDELNEQLPDEQRLKKSDDTVLFSRSGGIDSMALVNLIVAAEQCIEEEFGISIILADERAMSQTNSPFKTVGTLVTYASLLFEEEAHG